MNENNFEWDDKKVLEFVNFTLNTSPAFQGRYKDLEDFKKSKEQSSIPLDFEILSFVLNEAVFIKGEDNYFHCDWWTSKEDKWTAQELLSNDKGYKINSVLRKSDGEIFTVGDKCDGLRTITGFKIIKENDGSRWTEGLHVLGEKTYHSELKCCEKIKERVLLFTTEDGKPLYEEDSFWFILHDNTIGRGIARKPNDWSGHIFSTEYAAKEYILMNRPVLSLNDVLSVICRGNSYEHYKESGQYKLFLELVQKKINV